MHFTQHLNSVIRRAKAFYKTTEPGHFLISTSIQVETPSLPPLYEFDLDTQLTEWLDYSLQAARHGWLAKEGLDDDSVPSICLRFGIAEHSAWWVWRLSFKKTLAYFDRY